MDRFRSSRRIKFIFLLGVSFLIPKVGLNQSYAFFDAAEGDFPTAEFGKPPESPDLGIHPYSRKRPLASRAKETNANLASSSLTERKIASLETVVTRNQESQEVALIAGDLGFFPHTLFLTRNIPVHLFITAASKKNLCFMMDEFQIRKQVKSQTLEEVSFVPDQSGQYRFYCPITGTEGKILVREAATLAKERHGGS